MKRKYTNFESNFNTKSNTEEDSIFKYQKNINFIDILNDIVIEDTFIFICQKCKKECVGFLDTNKIYNLCIFCR